MRGRGFFGHISHFQSGAGEERPVPAPDKPPLMRDLIMRHIFLTGHGGHEMLFCLRGRLWANVFGTNHRVHSSDDRARAGNVAGGVVAPGLWETELAQPQR